MPDIATLTMKADSREIRTASHDLDKLEKNAKKTEKATGDVNKGFLSMSSILRKLGPLMAGVSAGAIAANMIRVAKETERYNAQLRTMTGSLGSAQIEFDRLNKFARETPYTLKQSIDGFVKLKALGLDPSERAMKSYGNTASAMGKSMQQMIEAVADASTNEFERLKEFGIKSKQQGDLVTFTFQGVETTIQKSSKNIQEYLLNIGETKFADAMSNQMDTIDGQLSNLGMSFDDLWRVMGEGLGVSGMVKDALNWVSEAVDNAAISIKFFTDNLKADAIAENAQAIAETVTQIESANIALSMLKGSKATGAINSYNLLIADAQKRLKSLGIEYKILNPLIKKITTDTNEASGVQTTYNSTLRGTTESLKEIIDDYDDMDRAMDLIIAQFDELDAAEARKIAGLEKTTAGTKKVIEETKKYQKLADPTYTAWENAFSRLDDAGADMWDNLYKGAENSLDSIEDLLYAWLAEMSHALITKPLMMNFQAAVLGSGSVGGSVGGASVSGGTGSFIQALQGGLMGNSINAGITSAVNNGIQSAFGGQLNLATGTKGFLGSNIGMAGAGLAAGFLGDKLFGGYGGAGSSIGTTLGSAFGPWGMLAGGLLGGSLGGLFGGDSDTTPDLSLKYSSNGNLSDPTGSKLKTYGAESNGSYDPQFNIGGRFAEINWGSQHDAFSSQSDVDNFAAQISTRYLTLENMIFNAFGEQISKEISLAMDSFSTGEIKIEEFAGAGDFNKAFNKIFSSIFVGVGRNLSDDISRYEKVFTDAMGVTGSLEASTGLVGAVKSIADAGSSRSFTSIVDVMTNFVSGVDELETQMIELVAATQLLTAENNGLFTNLITEIIDLNQIEGMTAQRGVELITVLTSVNAIFETLKLNTYDYTIAGANLSETLAAGAGGMDALIAKTAYYYDNFYTDLEKNNRIIELGQKALEDFGVASVTSTQSLRAYIETLSGDEYEALFNSALNLAPALVAMEKAIEDKNKLEITGINDAGDALDEFYSNMLKHIQDIDDYLNGLQFSDLSTLTNQQQFDAAGQQFFSTVNAARSGDLDAAGNLTSVSQTFLEIARTIYTSSNAYQAVYGTVTDALGTISSMSEVEAAYISTLGRTGEAAGISYWEGTGLTGDALSSAMLNASANVPQSARDYLFESGQSVPANSSGDVASALQSLQAEIAAQTEAIVASNYDANEQNAVKIIDGTVERTAVVLR